MIEATIEAALTIFLMFALIAQLVAIRFKIPYTLVFVFIGVGITTLSSVALSISSNATIFFTPISWIQSVYYQLVNSGLFVGLIVPPLIFEAMMHIRRESLNAVAKPALILATVGVLISTIVAGVVVWKFTGLSPFLSLVFAAIISPTDTITVLQIFKHLKVPSKLSTLMDMEAALNDATAIVLFSIILSISSVSLLQSSIFRDVGIFLYDLIGGFLIGIIISRLAKPIHASIDDKLAEIILTVVVVYGSYVLATALGASGLIAVTIVGLYFGNNTARMTLKKKLKLPIMYFWEIAAFMGNAIAFFLIGFVVNISLLLQAAALIIIAYLSTIISRLVTVYPIFALFHNPRNGIPFKWSNIAFLGGIRGALSIALVATLTSSAVISSQDLSTITTMVIGVVFVSIILQVPALSIYAGKFFGKYHTAYPAND